ncbi:MAG: gliding motility-associated C-terminal domain-containing protein, partial [Bacteroidota bacterium]
VQVNIGRCQGGDTINVSYNPLPIFNLGNDTLLCEGDQLTLSINTDADLIQWQDGSADNTLEVRAAGIYRATTTLNDCPFTDEIMVDYQASRSFSLGPDTTICDEQTYSLRVDQRADRISWQDGSNDRNFTVMEAGRYSVEVVDGACTFSDTVFVNTRDCFRFRAYKPTAFSPNNDGFNDVFQIGLPPTISVEVFEMEVYNRWGVKVFQSNSFEEGWTGILNGEVLPGGVYLYNIRIKYSDDFKSDERIISGDVVLLR